MHLGVTTLEQAIILKSSNGYLPLGLLAFVTVIIAFVSHRNTVVSAVVNFTDTKALSPTQAPSV